MEAISTLKFDSLLPLFPSHHISSSVFEYYTPLVFIAGTIKVNFNMFGLSVTHINTKKYSYI